MKLIGTPGHGKKHLDAVTNKYGLRRRGDSRRWEKCNNAVGGHWVYLWPIEGEQVSMREIFDRCPGIAEGTILSRINNGDRTWKRLQRPTEKVAGKTPEQKAAYKEVLRKRRLMDQVRRERMAYFAKLREGHAKL